MIGVAVVTYRSAAVLPGLLDSLPAGLAGVDGWRLVVADNSGAGSDDAAATARAVHARFPDALVLDLGGNRGYAAGVNACARALPGAEALLVLNPDVRLRPSAVAALLGALRGTADATGAQPVGIAVPRLLGTDGALGRSLRRRPTVRRALGEALLGGHRAARFPALSEVVADPSAYAAPSTADWASGAVMAIGRECMDVVGPWDESFFLYSEETDFALRARDARFALRLVPEAEAVHVGGDAHVSPPLWALLVANRVVLFARRNGRARSLAFWLALALGEALRAVRTGVGGATHRAALRMLLRQRRPILGGRCVEQDFSP